MNKCLVLFLIIAFFTASCAPAPAAPTQPPTATASPKIVPSPTLAPILENQEHLIVTRDHTHFAFFNPDGGLQKYLEIPKDSFIGRIEQAISPDGNWIVYETDSFDNPHELSLKLLNLRDETTLSISRLISPQFPENIKPIIETIHKYDQVLYESDCYSDPKCLSSLVQDDIVLSAG